MNLGLKGKKAIVTAASKGLGRAVALRLAEEGVELAICARGIEGLRRIEEEIQRAGGRVFSAAADVSDRKIHQRLRSFGSRNVGSCRHIGE